MTGIFGVKAYRCLNDSWIVLSVVAAIQAAITGLLLFDTFHLAQSIRNLTGEPQRPCYKEPILTTRHRYMYPRRRTRVLANCLHSGVCTVVFRSGLL